MAPNLLELPEEMKLDILDKLPAKDIQKLRGVCKTLQNVVNTNKVKIANAKMEQERKRIVDHLNYHVFCIDNPTFMERLSRFHELRGAWRCTECYELVSNLVLRHALQVFPIGSLPSFAELLTISKGLAAAYEASCLGDTPAIDRDKILLFLEGKLDEYQLQADAIEQLCDEAMVEAAGLFRYESHPSSEHYTTLQPSLLLSGLDVVGHTGERGSGEQETIPGICMPSELSGWFELPALPDSTFAYCVKNSRLYKYCKVLLNILGICLSIPSLSSRRR